MEVVIKTIPHSEQRYPTVGDWWWEDGTLHIRVSDMGDWRKEMCVAYHELFEALACKRAGVSQEDVDAFDKAFEAKRANGSVAEPGNDPAAPYFQQHQAAINPELWLAYYLDVDWNEYAETLEGL